jgi:adenylate cyclase
VAAADLVAGRTPGARDIYAAFADLVGFTRLGESIPPEALGAVARRLEELAGMVVHTPVRLVKTVGDAVMLVCPEPGALLDTALSLVEAAEAEGADFPQLRAGVASGPALERAGDWFGTPVNLASRVTSIARAGSVLVTEPVKSAARDDFAYSFAGARRMRGIASEVPLFRVRRLDD